MDFEDLLQLAKDNDAEARRMARKIEEERQRKLAAAAKVDAERESQRKKMEELKKIASVLPENLHVPKSLAPEPSKRPPLTKRESESRLPGIKDSSPDSAKAPKRNPAAVSYEDLLRASKKVDLSKEVLGKTKDVEKERREKRRLDADNDGDRERKRTKDLPKSKLSTKLAEGSRVLASERPKSSGSNPKADGRIAATKSVQKVPGASAKRNEDHPIRGSSGVNGTSSLASNMRSNIIPKDSKHPTATNSSLSVPTTGNRSTSVSPVPKAATASIARAVNSGSVVPRGIAHLSKGPASFWEDKEAKAGQAVAITKTRFKEPSMEEILEERRLAREATKAGNGVPAATSAALDRANSNISRVVPKSRPHSNNVQKSPLHKDSSGTNLGAGTRPAESLKFSLDAKTSTKPVSAPQSKNAQKPSEVERAKEIKGTGKPKLPTDSAVLKTKASSKTLKDSKDKSSANNKRPLEASKKNEIAPKRVRRPDDPFGERLEIEKLADEEYVEKNASSIIAQMFGYNRNRYHDDEDSDDDMEAGFSHVAKEEARSLRKAQEEDEREAKLEEQRKLAKLKRANKK